MTKNNIAVSKRPATETRITAFERKYATGMVTGDHGVHALPLSQALARRWPSDAHFAAYEPRRADDGSILRLRSTSKGKSPSVFDALHELDTPSVRMVLLVGDIDGPKHAATPEWRAETVAKIEASGLAYYQTKNGFRVLASTDYEITSPADADTWKIVYLGWIEYLRQTHGLMLDPACSDWTRLYRLPNVVRDGKAQISRLVGSIPEFDADRHWIEPPVNEARKIRAKAPEPVAAPSGDGAARVAREAQRIAEVIETLTPHYTENRHPLVRAIGGWLAGPERDPFAPWCDDQIAAVIRALPSDQIPLRVHEALKAAAQARSGAATAGWNELQARLGPTDVARLEKAARSAGDRRWDARTADRMAAWEALNPTLRDNRWHRLGGVPAAVNDTLAKAGTAGSRSNALGKPCSFLAPEEPIEYICEGLSLATSDGKISLLAGEPGGGKGPIANHLAVCFALGLPAFGVHSCTQSNVLLLDCEGARLTMRRLRRLARGLERDPAELDGKLHVFDASAESLADPAYHSALASFVKQHSIRVLVLDSYTPAMLGAGVEANQPEFALLAKSLGQLGILVLAIAHANKAAANRGGDPRLSDVAYSGAFAAMAQTAIVVSYPIKTDRNTIRLACARAPETGFAAFEVVCQDGEGGALEIWLSGQSSGVKLAAEREKEAERKQAETIGRRADEIEKVLQRQVTAMSTRNLKPAASLNGSTWPAARDLCLERGSIAMQRGGGGSENWYWVEPANRTHHGRTSRA